MAVSSTKPIARCSQISPWGERFCIGRTSESREKLRCLAVSVGKQGKETVDGFGEVLGLFIPIYYKYERTFRRLPQQHRVHSNT